MANDRLEEAYRQAIDGMANAIERSDGEVDDKAWSLADYYADSVFRMLAVNGSVKARRIA